ncbi:MAG TPA: hypothetical protein VH302_08815 [Bryobacteraceae bacterium]|jgi:hypothetical protein|nr:hypothetical protein [Bryobacteraceae bacterium]
MRHGHGSRADRQIADELWLRDVSRVPTSYGRLVYLAGLLNPDTGTYEYYGTGSNDMANANRSLKKTHELSFRDWVAFPLERKMADVQAYISGLDIDRAELIDAWLRLTPYKNLVPASIQGPERRKHISDFEAILGLLRNVYGVASPDPVA